MVRTKFHPFFFLLFFSCFACAAYGMENDEKANDIVSVIKYGVKNNGSIIGSELNELVKNSYGKTIYFPAGVYNLSEAIILPFDYTKNVNIVFDKNALIKSDSHLEALLKIGYSEMSTPDVTHRRFSYIEGGMFDCSNVDNGILVNGLKQLVSLKSISLFKGRKTHIRIQVSDDFRGTGSSDTKIENITIQGISSNEEVYGIYIDHSCCDCKISNTFIYGTKYGLVTKSAGHILNNVHILSMKTTGGVDLGTENFRHTEGIRIETDGFFVLNEIYFDTIDKSVIIAADKNPTLMMDKNIFYSYLKNFGTSFIYKDHSSVSSFQVKISNSIIEVAKEGYKIFDVNPVVIENDVEGNFSFVNNAIRSPQLLNPFDLSLMQRVKGKYSDALFSPGKYVSESQWYALGASLSSYIPTRLRIDLSPDCVVELDLLFEKNQKIKIDCKLIKNSGSLSFQIGYVIKDEYCILFINPQKGDIYPIVHDLSQSGSFLSTPSKLKCYTAKDYGVTEKPVLILEK